MFTRGLANAKCSIWFVGLSLPTQNWTALATRITLPLAHTYKENSWCIYLFCNSISKFNSCLELEKWNKFSGIIVHVSDWRFRGVLSNSLYFYLLSNLVLNQLLSIGKFLAWSWSVFIFRKFLLWFFSGNCC